MRFGDSSSATPYLLQLRTTPTTNNMASLLRRLSPFAGLLGSRTFATPFFSRAWSSPAALTSMSNTLTASTSQSIGGVLQQTRGMKVHSSIKKRCEHCKVGLRPGCSSYAAVPSFCQGEVWRINGVLIGCAAQGRQATQWLPIHHLLGEPQAQAATGLTDHRGPRGVYRLSN